MLSQLMSVSCTGAHNHTRGLTELHFLLSGSVTLQCFQKVVLFWFFLMQQLSSMGIEQRPARSETRE